MENKRIDLIQIMLYQIKEEIDYQDEGEEVLIYALSLNRKELEDLLQARSYVYKLSTKVLAKKEVDISRRWDPSRLRYRKIQEMVKGQHKSRLYPGASKLSRRN